MWQENSDDYYDYYFFSHVYLGLELGIHMRECFNYLLFILEPHLLTNLDYFSRERNSCVILTLTVQGDVLFFIPAAEDRSQNHLGYNTATVRVQALLFTFSILTSFFSSSLIHHPLPTLFHHSSVSSSEWEISQGLRASCSPGTCSPHPHPGEKTAPPAPSPYRAAQIPPSAPGQQELCPQGMFVYGVFTLQCANQWA